MMSSEISTDLFPRSLNEEGKFDFNKFIENAPCVPDEVIAKHFDCLICRDTKSVIVERLGARPCECIKEKIRLGRFRRAVELTPPLFSWITDGLNSIEPRADIHPKHPEYLAKLKRNYEKSFYFFGKTGTHKTTFSWALLQEAGRSGSRVGGNSGKGLSDTLRNYEFNQTLPRDASFYALEQLESRDARFCLLIDEIEMFKLSEYGLSLLFEIVEKILQFKHQLIVTSNKSLDELLREWILRDGDGKANAANYCEKLSRRLKELCAPIDLS